jgi:hypothetical protein
LSRHLALNVLLWHEMKKLWHQRLLMMMKICECLVIESKFGKAQTFSTVYFNSF